MHFAVFEFGELTVLNAVATVFEIFFIADCFGSEQAGKLARRRSFHCETRKTRRHHFYFCSLPWPILPDFMPFDVTHCAR